MDPRLIFHGGGEIQFFPVFYRGWDFFQEFLREPGGILKYLSAFLSQFFYVGWLGAAILTAQAGLIYACGRMFFRAIGADHLRWLAYIPPWLLLALHSSYRYCFGPATGLLAALAFGSLYVHLRITCPWLRLAVVLGLSLVIYLFGESALPVFSLLVAVFELHAGRWRLAVASVVTAGVIPVAAGNLFFGLSSREALPGLLPFNWGVDVTRPRGVALVSGLYLVLPLAGAGWMLWRGAANRFFRRPSPAQPVKKSLAFIPGKEGRANKKAAERKAAVSSGWLLGTAGVLLITGSVAYGFLDRDLKAIIAVDYYAQNRMWPEVLAAGRGHAQNRYVANAINCALYQTGRLGHDLPLDQTPETLLLPENDRRAHWNKIDLCLDLGCVNEALHHLAEALALYGERPFLLKRLAVANIALGNVGTAKIYLRALTRTLFHAGWAADYLQRLETDPTLSQDAEVTRLRHLRPAQDELIPMPADQLLWRLVMDHKDNRMAGEYLLSHCLLTRNLAGFMKVLRGLGYPGEKILPPLHEEALVLAAKHLGNDTRPLPIPPDSEPAKRLERFIEAMKAAGGDPARAAARVQNEFGNSYFYYFYRQP